MDEVLAVSLQSMQADMARLDQVGMNLANEKWVSPASYWEIAIKIALGKYSLPEPYQVFMEREITNNNFRILHIEPRHTAVFAPPRPPAPAECHEMLRAAEDGPEVE